MIQITANKRVTGETELKPSYGGRKAARKSESSASRQGPSDAAARFSSHVLTRLLYPSCLILLTVAVYLPVRQHPFSINDDEQYVVNNPHLRGDFGWETVRWAFTTHDLANWHPLTWLSHAVDFQMFQLNPAGHHDMNLFFHVLNALLLFWVLQWATGCAGRSFVVAAIFALHPVNVETVAWIAERKNLLSMLFFLLALGAYRWYASRPRVGPFLLVTFLYALGLLAKPQIITFPFVLLLWDYWPLGRVSFGAGASDPGTPRAIPARRFSFLLLEKVPFLLLSAGSAVMTTRAQSLAGALRYYPFSYRLENAILSYVRYLGKAFWPIPLIPFYPHSPIALWQLALSLFLLLAITAFVIWRAKQRYLFVGWFWFLGTLVPMLGIVQVGEQAMADRYAYLSFIGIFFMMCWGIADWASQHEVPVRWLAVASAGLLVALSMMTYRQLSYWSSSVTLWSYTSHVTNGSYEAEENLGTALLEAGEPEDAMGHFERVIAITSNASGDMGREQLGDAAVAHLYLGAFDQQHGKIEEALDHYKTVLTLIDTYTAANKYGNVAPVLLKMKATALSNMGYVQFGQGQLAQAAASFQAALAINHHGAREWQGLGLVEQKSGDTAGAARAFGELARIDATDINLLLLAQAQEKNGQANEARESRQKAATLSSDLDVAQRQVDRMLAR